MADDRIIKLLEELKIICDELDWTLMVDLENEFFRGLVMGSEDYILDVHENNEDFDNYTILSQAEEELEPKRILH